MTDLLPVAYPLGADLQTALAIVEGTQFAEFYTGLADPDLGNCSYSHHFLPAGCMAQPDLRTLADTAHRLDRSLTVNLNSAVYRDEWHTMLTSLVGKIVDSGADAVVVSNIGVMRAVRQMAPDLNIHVSSIGGAINSGALAFYRNMGVERIILTRSASAQEVVDFARSFPDLEIEAFLMGGGCAFAEHSCNLPHFVFETEERLADLGSSAIYQCPHRGGCQSPAMVEHDDGAIELKMLHPGFGGCGLCYALPFVNAGVRVLKVTGRTQKSESLLSQALKINQGLTDALRHSRPPVTLNSCTRDKGECLYGKVHI